MDDLKKLSVERLRELARKHLGKGHSRLRTKAQLVEALKEVLKGPLSRLREVVEAVVPGRIRVVDFPPGRKGRVRAEHTAAEGRRRAASPTERARETTDAPVGSPAGPDGGRQAPSGGGRGPADRSGGRGRTRRTRTVAPPGAVSASETEVVPASREPPVEERFFETPATPRRSRRGAAPLEPLEPGPFASPREFGTDAPLLLVRDPTTLFVFWDFRRELERGAALGLREPRLLLRIYRGADLDRSLELPLGGRSTYVTGLVAGEEYTAEVLLLGRDGWTRPIGNRSAARRLPPGQVSARLEVRTLRLPWSEPLGQAPAPSTASPGGREPLDSPRRVALPSSPGARGPGQGPGPSGGPRSGRN